MNSICSASTIENSADFLIYLILFFGVLLTVLSSKLNARSKNENITLSIIALIAITSLIAVIGFWFEGIGAPKINGIDWRKASISFSFFVFAACISIIYSIIIEPVGEKVGSFAGYGLWTLAVIAQIITTFEYAKDGMVWRPAFSALISTLYGALGTALLVNVYIKKRS